MLSAPRQCSHYASLLLLIAWANLVFAVPALAQCDTNQAFGAILRLSKDSTVQLRTSVYFRLETPSDSGHTIYTIGEFQRNGHRIHLHGWCRQQIIKTLGASQLSDTTRTSPFSVLQGDTISFYRELNWFNPHASNRAANGYFHPDTLEYAIELVKKSTGARFALLDSLGVLRRVPSGSAQLYGSRPILDRIRYIVPSAISGDSVFIRIVHYARGNGDYYTMRYDGMTANLSDRLLDSSWISFVNAFGGGLGKLSPQSLSEEAGDLALLELSPNPTKGATSIRITGVTGSGPFSVAVYADDGRLDFVPLSAAFLDPHTTISYTPKYSGKYFVVLYRDNQILCVRKLVVTR